MGAGRRADRPRPPARGSPGGAASSPVRPAASAREIAGTFHAHGADGRPARPRHGGQGGRRRTRRRRRGRRRRATPLPSALRSASSIDELGGVDVLVNNAGILRITPLLDITVDEWDLVMDVNARSMLVATQVAARSMIAAARRRRRSSGRDRRQDHQHGEHGRQAGRRQPGPLRRVEGRRLSLTQVARDRARPARHHRQRHLPRATC